MRELLRILIIDAQKQDVSTMRQHLDTFNQYQLSIEIAESLARGVLAIKNSYFDVVLLNLDLPDSKGFVTCMTLLDKFPNLPIIVIAQDNQIDVAKWAAKMGAQNYILKKRFAEERTAKIIDSAIESTKLARQLEMFTDDLKEIRERLEHVLTLAKIGSWELDPHENEMYWSDEVYDIIETAKEATPATFSNLVDAFDPEQKQLLSSRVSLVLSHGHPFNFTLQMRKEESVKWLNFRARRSVRRTGDGNMCCGIVQDITDRIHVGAQ